MFGRAIDRLKYVVVEKILQVHDTPHRIALGVLLGWFVMWTPTLGLQILIYLALAALFRANKASGMPILFISNVFTAVPLYWFVWKVGALVVGAGGDNIGKDELSDRLNAMSGHSIWDAAFWQKAKEASIAMGSELWIGSLILGAATGIVFYFVSLYAVRAYRVREEAAANALADEKASKAETHI